jgi:hypothetical protein
LLFATDKTDEMNPGAFAPRISLKRDLTLSPLNKEASVNGFASCVIA